MSSTESVAPGSPSGPALRDLFSEALEIWRRTQDPQSDDLWRLASDAATHGRKAYDIGLHFLKSPDAAQRVVAVDILAMVAVQNPPAGLSVAKAMIDLLTREQDNNVRWSALVALGPTGSDRALPALVPWTKDENADLRCQAVQAMTLVMEVTGSTPEGISTLISSMEDPDPEVKYWSTTSIADSLTDDSDEIRDALSRRLFDSNDDIRNEAIYGLAKRKDPRMNMTLEQALLTPRPAPRVFDAVEVFDNVDLLPVLKQANAESISEDRLQSIIDGLDPGAAESTWPTGGQS